MRFVRSSDIHPQPITHPTHLHEECVRREQRDGCDHFCHAAQLVGLHIRCEDRLGWVHKRGRRAWMSVVPVSIQAGASDTHLGGGRRKGWCDGTGANGLARARQKHTLSSRWANAGSRGSAAMCAP